jgi:hypothetical protein
MNLPFIGILRMTGVGRKCEYRLLGVNGKSCCIPEVQMSLGNGKLPPDTFRLAGPNITKHLTARIRSKPEAQKISLNFRDVL